MAVAFVAAPCSNDNANAANAACAIGRCNASSRTAPKRDTKRRHANAGSCTKWLEQKMATAVS
eukprot:6702147-Lingulodinium_polyedra.AAC.1